jgi:hypothetical protein
MFVACLLLSPSHLGYALDSWLVKRLIRQQSAVENLTDRRVVIIDPQQVLRVCFPLGTTTVPAFCPASLFFSIRVEFFPVMFHVSIVLRMVRIDRMHITQ